MEIQTACCCQHHVNYNCQKPAPVLQGKVLVHWIQKHICSSFVLWKCYSKNKNKEKTWHFPSVQSNTLSSTSHVSLCVCYQQSMERKKITPHSFLLLGIKYCWNKHHMICYQFPWLPGGAPQTRYFLVASHPPDPLAAKRVSSGEILIIPHLGYPLLYPS